MRGLIIFISVIFLTLSFKANAQKRTGEKSRMSMRKEQLSDRDKLNYEVAFFNGLRQKALGNLELALKDFLSCVRLDGNNSAPMYELALIYSEFNQYSDALFFIKSACEINPDNIWYQQLLADTYVSNQKYKLAIITYRKLLKEQPGNDEWHFQLASAYLLDNQLRNAIGVYNDMEKYIGVNETLIMQKHRIYLELKDKRGAKIELEKWILSEPKNPKPYGLIAEMYLLEGNQKKAIETLERILEIAPKNGKANLTLSDLYRNNGEKVKAFEALKIAFASSGLSIDSKMRILITYYDISSLDSTLKNDAFDLVEILKKSHPNDAKPYTIAGDFYYREGDLKNAKNAFETALQFDQSRFAIWQQLLIICLDLNEFELVISYAQKAMDLFPSQPISYLLSGMSHIQNKSYNNAITVLNTGKMMVFENNELLAQFYSSLGDAYHAQKEHNLSDESYENSLELSPLNTYVLNNYSYYLSLRRENLDKALEMMEVCTALNPGIASYEDTYAWVFYQKGYYDKALEWLERAFKSGGNNSAVIVEHYGDVLFQLGKVAEAVEQWKKAKELGSDSSFIDQKISEQQLYE